MATKIWQKPVVMASAGALLLTVVACSPTVTVHGFVPTQEEIESIEPGIDSILTLEDRIGRPSSTGLLRESSWYYVQTTVSQLTYNPPEVTDRVIVAVDFDDDGLVTDINSYGIEDGRIVNLNPRITTTGGARLSILQQLFGNLANINPEDFFN